MDGGRLGIYEDQPPSRYSQSFDSLYLSNEKSHWLSCRGRNADLTPIQVFWRVKLAEGMRRRQRRRRRVAVKKKKPLPSSIKWRKITVVDVNKPGWGQVLSLHFINMLSARVMNAKGRKMWKGCKGITCSHAVSCQ